MERSGNGAATEDRLPERTPLVPRPDEAARSQLSRSADGGQWMELLHDLPDLRWAKVARARRNILACVYDQGECMDHVVSYLVNEVGGLPDDHSATGGR